MSKTKKLVLAAMFAALTCIATMIIRIPTPTKGYLNLGDGVVLASGYILGPVFGAAAAGIGSMLADVFAGYMSYAPATLVIKAAVAAAAALLAVVLPKKFKINYIAAGIIAEIIMVGGYFVFEYFVMGEGVGAFAGVGGNIAQAVAGVVVSVIIMSLKNLKNIQQANNAR